MRHRIAIAATAAACCLLVTSCQMHLLVPTGKAPKRYRDAIFTTVDTTKALTYGKAIGEDGKAQTLLLDLYQPHGDTVTKRPAIVWVHGGGFSTGDRTSPELVDEANTFAKEGYVNVSIDYRLVSGGCAPFQSDCITGIGMAKEDAQAAVRFLRAHATTYKIDVNRIAVGGSSAGAITAYNVAYGSNSVGNSGNPGFSSKVESAVSLSGAALTTGPHPGDPPTMDFHGTADGLVPLKWAQSTIKAALAAGDVAEQTVWTGDGHVPYVKHRTEILTETRNFLYWSLRCAVAAH